MIDESLLSAIEKVDLKSLDRRDDSLSSISHLLALGRKKSFVTIDDIIGIFPDAEQDVDQLEDAFAALISAGITYIDDVSLGEPTDREIDDVEEDPDDESLEPDQNENYLSNIDTDDTIGLYLKEVLS